MLNQRFKIVLAILAIAGAMGATSAATPTHRASPVPVAQPAAATRRHPARDEGCRELPVSVPVAVVSCSEPPRMAP